MQEGEMPVWKGWFAARFARQKELDWGGCWRKGHGEGFGGRREVWCRQEVEKW